MKIFILGKKDSIVHWVEDAAAGFRAAGHAVEIGITRNPRIAQAIDRLLVAPAAGQLRTRALLHRIRRFAPDLILAITFYHMPTPLLAALHAMPGRAPILAWVGDKFSPAEAAKSGYADAFAYTDKGLLADHARLVPGKPAHWVPHAAKPLPTNTPIRPAAERVNRLLFVAAQTPYRQSVIAGITAPITLIGPGWGGLGDTVHEVQNRRIDTAALLDAYGTHRAVLNAHNEHNTLSGLNQRHFDPYLFATPVLSDPQPDLSACFEIGREILVWESLEQLNELHDRIRHDPGLAMQVGEAGRRRVLAEHSYGQRLTQLAALVR